ncbi:MAG: ATP-binding protein [Proteobacteria bacterium]|nr:MAG: ATP-binding protein [Pseudomonadota bacterium]
MSEPAAPPTLEELAVVRARIADRLSDTARTIAVMSGKGGVGKTFVAVHLALALARRGLRVGLLDADLNSPSVAKMLGLRGQPLRATSSGLRPVPGPAGIAVQSMDFFLQGTQPLDWDGPAGEGSGVRSVLEEAALADLLGSTEWGALDALVVDLAPGPDRLPALVHLVPALGSALAVTIPSEVSLLAVERSVRRAHEAGIPMLGVVENMASSVCAHCGAEGPLFREASTDAIAAHLDLAVLARIPFDARAAAAADAGAPLAGGAGGAFDKLAEAALRGADA